MLPTLRSRLGDRDEVGDGLGMVDWVSGGVVAVGRTHGSQFGVGPMPRTWALSSYRVGSIPGTGVGGAVGVGDGYAASRIAANGMEPTDSTGPGSVAPSRSRRAAERLGRGATEIDAGAPTTGRRQPAARDTGPSKHLPPSARRGRALMTRPRAIPKPESTLNKRD
jgi:hypothetical protein